MMVLVRSLTWAAVTFIVISYAYGERASPREKRDAKVLLVVVLTSLFYLTATEASGVTCVFHITTATPEEVEP